MLKPPRQLPIRLRLTLWYVLLMAITFTAFGVFLYTQFQRSLMASLDASLQLTTSQTVSSFDIEEDLAESGSLIFEVQDLARGFTMRLLSPENAVWDSAGDTTIPWGAIESGFTTQTDGNIQWRVYTEPIVIPEDTLVGWIQAAQSLETANDTLEDFRDQLLWGIPLILILAGAGGYFLANRALQPITHITATAQEITARDLSRRLDYPGPADEIGRLAQTFDEMLARLQNAFRREQRFTGDAAHELRTPLTVLKGQIEVTLSRPRKREEYETKLQELGVQVDRLIRLTNALLFLSRSDQHQLAWNPVRLNLTEILEVIAEQFQPAADEKSILLQVSLPLDLPVYGNSDHLTRLFLNLLDNAVKYTPRGGQITIRAVSIGVCKAELPSTNDPARTMITIHNSGPGIAPEHLPHLFERFYRADDDRSRESGGDGLGLAIAQEIVRLHGGEICAKSEPGQGGTFTVSLPDQPL